LSKKKKSYKKLALLFWVVFIIPIGLFVLMMFAAANSWVGFPPLPSFEELENPQSNLATEVYTSDGKILGKYFYQNRVNVQYEDLSPFLVDAFISTEDERYREHSGIDFRSLTRAVLKLGKNGGGSTVTQQLAKMLFSGTPMSGWGRLKQKLQEWIISAQLERRYTKDEIIAMYFNRFDFINNAVGIKSGAKVYFGVQPSELKIEEAACLVGMLKNPSYFNPITKTERVTKRRNTVLFQMKRNGLINQNEYDSLTALPLTLTYSKVTHRDGVAPYFREILRSDLKKIFSEKDENGNYLLSKDGGETPYNIYKDGLKVFTTINYKMQEYAEFAVREHLSHELQEDFFRNLKKRKNNPFSSDLTKKQVENILKAAVRRSERYLIMSGKQCNNCGRRGKILEDIVIDGHDFVHCTAEDCGEDTKVFPSDSIWATFDTPVPMKVFSYKGKIDTVMSPMDSIRYYKSFLQSGMMSMDPRTGYIKAWVGGIDYEHFAYDHVRQGKRQVGSTFKPFVYSVAVDEGYSPCYELPNVPVTFYKGEYGILKDWTPKNSDGEYGGTVSLKYGLANSLNTVTAKLMKLFGPDRVIKMARSMGISSKLEPTPALALGSADISVFEMVGAFSTFANKGTWTEPIYLTRIEDKNGNVIVDYIPKVREVLTEEKAYVMLDFLKGVTSYNYNKLKGKNIGGTGIRLTFPKTEKRPYGGINYPVAGKTGTTQNNSDGWFMGVTPDLVTGVWVGA
jgi:penicillin-binding protein 1A